jgi:hypothetical protein
MVCTSPCDPMKEAPVASDLLDITKTTQDQFLSAMGAVQDTMVEGYAKWAGTVSRLIPARVTSMVPEVPYLPKPTEAMDLSFGFAEKLLASQKAFAQKLVATADTAPAKAAAPAAKK